MMSRAEYAINNSANSSTRQTPCMLLYGVPQRGPEIDTEYLDELQVPPIDRNLSALRQSADIKQSQARNEEPYLKQSFSPRQYKLGDFVVIRNVDTALLAVIRN